MGRSRQTSKLVSNNILYADTSVNNIGVGTTTPQYKLDVVGDINFTGTFRQNGSPFVASRWTAGSGDNIYRLDGNVGIATTNPTSKLTVNGDVLVSGVVTANSLSLPNNSFLSGILTTSSTSEVPLASFSTSTYRSVKMNVQVSYGSTHKITELLVIHNGAETFFTEYGTVSTNEAEYEPSSLASFTSDLNSGNFRILVTPQYSGSTTIKYIANLFTI